MKAAGYLIGGAALALALAGCRVPGSGGGTPSPSAHALGAAAPSGTGSMAPTGMPTGAAPSGTGSMAPTGMPTVHGHRGHHRHHVPPPGAMGPGQCTPADLTVVLGTTGHAAGSTFQQIDFHDTGMRACTLAGYPGAALTSGRSPSGQLGAAAGHNPVQAFTVTLKPGQWASSLLRVSDPANFPAAQGHVVTSADLQVYIPNTGGRVYLPDAVPCTTVSSVPLLQVSPVTADESGPA